MPADPTSPDLEPYQIIGIRDGIGPNGRVPVRREITEWHESSDPVDDYQVELFLLALSAFQARNEHEKLSYFQIAGIHGMPNIKWNENTTPQSKDASYCTHNSMFFPLWHRPYIVLYEQVLYDIMTKEVIPSCPTTNPKDEEDTNFHETLRDAAKTWRLPHWDWAATSELPSLVKPVTFPILIKQVPDLDGVPKGHIYNPLNRFEMPSGDPMGEWGVNAIPQDVEQTRWRPYHKAKGLSRCADFDDKKPKDAEPPPHWVKGTINNDKAGAALKGGKWYDDKDPYTLKENVYRLFSSKDLKKFAAFSTTLYQPSAEQEALQGADKKKDSGSSSSKKQDNNPFGGVANILGGIQKDIHQRVTKVVGLLGDPGLDKNGKKDVEQSYSSLEFIHNNIHSWIGGPDGLTAGHMADVPVAGFDPVFWLHHANIDRLCAIWQTLNPNSWFDKREEQLLDPGNWSMKENTLSTPTTPFPPFHRQVKPQPEYYNSNSVRDWTKLGYTYPELQPWKYKNHNEYIRTINTTLNKLYGATKKLVQSAPKFSFDPAAAAADFQVLAGLENDYVINVVYRKFALGGIPFTINFYLTHHEGQSEGRTRIGRVYNFSSALATSEDEGHCTQCLSQARLNVKASGSIPLTNVMIKKAQDPDCPLFSLAEDDTVDFLRKNLTWEITDRSETVIPLDPRSPFIEVSVAIGTPEHADPLHLLSTYSSYTIVSSITNNKVGGIGYVPPQ